MNPLLKLIIPISLGVAAGGLNWYVMNSGPPPRSYAVVKTPIGQGQVFREDAIEELVVPGNVGNVLPRTAVPYEHASTLVGRQATRTLKKGDLVLWQDTAQPGWELAAAPDEEALPVSLEGLSTVPRLIRVGDQIGFLVAHTPPSPKAKPDSAAPRRMEDPDVEYVGPFRVLSVGERVSRDEKDKRGGTGGNERVITVAMKLEAGKKIDPKTRSLLVAKYMERAGGNVRIVGVVLHASRKQEPAAPG